MKKILKQTVGIDVAQKELVVCLGRLTDQLATELYARRAFINNKAGIKALAAWALKNADGSLPMHFAMEATGVYHEHLAYYLHSAGCPSSVIMPNKVINYHRSLQTKTVTDKVCAETIAAFALSRTLDAWEPPNPLYLQLKQLTRERTQIVDCRTVAKNQLHAEMAGAQPNPSSARRLGRHIALLNKQEKEVIGEIAAVIKSDPKLSEDVKLLSSMKGVGMLTAATIIGETNGFHTITSRKQLTSYAGLDVKDKQSGTSVNGKSRISKRGNRFLRRCLYNPAMSAARYDERYKAIYARLVDKHGIRMKAGVAIQRRLLEMAFTIYKTRVPYNEKYLQELEEHKIETEALAA